MFQEFNNKKNIKKTKNQEKELEEEFLGGSRALSDHEILALAVARIAKNREVYEAVLNLLEEVEAYKLSGTLHKVSLDRDTFWVQIEKRCSLSSDEIDELLSGGSINDGLKFLQILKKYLHDNAMSVLPITYGMKYTGLDPVLVGMFENPTKISKGIVLQKESEMKNFCKKFMKTLDERVAQRLTSDSLLLTYVRQVCGNIFNSQFDLKLNPSKYRTPKEAGISMPHTFSSKDWLSGSVSAFIDKQFGGKMVTCFYEEDFSGIRPYHGVFSDYMIVSSDKQSAYHLTTSPALFVAEKSNSIWEWRQIQQSLKLQIAGQVRAENVKGMKSDIVRALFIAEKEAIEEYMVANESVDITEMSLLTSGCLTAITEDFAALFGGSKEVIIQFFKRGYSKKQEVEDNDDVVHIVKASIAEQFSGDDFFPVALPDFQSVILFPMDIWRLSKQYKKKTQRLLNTSYGHRFIKGDTAYSIALVYNLLQATLTFRMLDNIHTSEYVLEEDAEHLKSLLLQGHLNGLLDLLPFNTRKARLKFVDSTFHFIPGIITGIFVCPQSSRKGKDEMNDLIERAGMEKIIDQFDGEDDEDVEIDLQSFFSTGIQRRLKKKNGDQTSDLEELDDM